MKFKSYQLLVLIFIVSSCGNSLWGQGPAIDPVVLRGSITPQRAWWDLTYYHLDLTVNPADSTIKGVNRIQYEVLQPEQIIQIDLQPPLGIERIEQDGEQLNYEHIGNAYFIRLAKNQIPGSIETLEVYYGGRPHIALRAPWDGGFSFKYDEQGNPFIATSCQGIGASIWFPCKDHLYDEPDSVLLSITVPSQLQNISNGRLRKIDDHGATKTYHWFVNNPINNYGINVNIGNYIHERQTYLGENGSLDIDVYLLPSNEEHLNRQFLEIRRMLRAFEYWFGPYPFYGDGYKLVEVPYLGMEHQSSITYGNGYQNGYRGSDLSGTGWGLLFDFIIIHESGHEWFANNITYKDIADMWVHESFTNYSESLFLDYHYGKNAGSEYCIGTRKRIQNDIPIIGEYGLNKRGSGDMYYKGGNLLHTLRSAVNNDELFRQVLRGLNDAFYHQTVDSKQIEDYMARHLKMDLRGFFDQYLRDIRIPVLSARKETGGWQFRWDNTVDHFNLPVRVFLDGEAHWIHPKNQWNQVHKEASAVEVDPNWYVELQIVEDK